MSGQKTLIRRVEQVLDGIQSLCIFIASIALATLVVTFGWLVFGRYVLNITPTWVEQLSLLLICYIVFLGAAAGVRTNGHLGVSVFRDMLPITFQKVVLIATDLIIATFGFITVLSCIGWVAFGWDSLIPMLDVPESVRSAAVTIFGGLIFLFAGTRALFRILTFSDWSPDESLTPEQA